MRAISRVTMGLAAALLLAAVIAVAHVITPRELAGLSGQPLMTRLARFGELVALTATQQSLFALPFALIATLVAEINRLRGWTLYAGLGIAIAAAGFCVQTVGEGDARTIVNDYAVRAFLEQGFFAGLAYWLIAGRFAGWRRGGPLVRARPHPLAQLRRRVANVTDSDGAASR